MSVIHVEFLTPEGLEEIVVIVDVAQFRVFVHQCSFAQGTDLAAEVLQLSQETRWKTQQFVVLHDALHLGI
eukprot:3247328-Rhodomonas_salina.1